MSSTIPNYRWPLNDDQLKTLELLYKFRYSSSDLIAQYFNKPNGNFVYKRLKILQEQGYIGKRFDSSYRIKGKSAAYYLLPKGARKLQEQRGSEDKDSINIKTIYRNKSASETFISHCLNILTAYNSLKVIYGDRLSFFTRSDLVAYDYFPSPLPTAFITLKGESDDRHFFFELLSDSQPFFAHVRRMQQYAAYYDSDEWDVTETSFPTILLVCSSKALQTRMMKYLSKQGDELSVYTTSFDQLKNKSIWIGDQADQDEAIALEDIA